MNAPVGRIVHEKILEFSISHCVFHIRHPRLRRCGVVAVQRVQHAGAGSIRN
jgi:hypothetical protein